MNSMLSPRLLACCGFVAPGDRVADVGCDHGYLGIHLLQSGIASFVYAGDVNEGPLQSAVRNAEKYGLSEQIRFFLSDGVQAFPRDFDTMVCAGMGADTMVSILEAAPWLQDGHYRLILQCQSKTHFLRRYLAEHGWRITEETVIRDGRFLYTVMEVVWQKGYSLTPGQWYFPPALLENPAAELPAYYQQVVFRLQRAVDGQKDQADPILVQALQELVALGDDPQFIWLKEKKNGNC